MLRNRYIKLLFFLLFIAVFMTKLKFEMNELEKLHVNISRHINENGFIYSVDDNTKGTVYIRKTSYGGTLISSISLNASEGVSFFKRSIIDVSDDNVYVLEQSRNMIDYTNGIPNLVKYDMMTRKGEIIYTFEKNSSLYPSPKIYNDTIYISSLNDTSLNVMSIKKDGSISERKIEDCPADFSNFYVDKNGTILVSTINSQIFRYDKEWLEIYSMEDGYAIADISLDEFGNVYILKAHTDSSLSSTLVLLNTSSKSVETITSFDKMRSLSISNGNTYALLDEEFNIKGRVKGREFTIAKKLYLPFWRVIDVRFLVETGIYYLVIISSLGLIYWYVHLRRVLLLVKQMLLIIPVFTIGAFLLVTFTTARLEPIILDKTREILKRSAIANAVTKADSISLNSLDTNDTNDTKQADQELSFWNYTVIDKIAYIDSCGRLIRNLPVYFTQKQADGGEVAEMIEKKESVFQLKYSNVGDGLWFCALAPILDYNNEIIGFVEAGIPYIQLNNTVERAIRLITVSIAIILITALIVYLLGLYLSLRYLSSFKKGAEAISAGNYDFKIKINTRDEFADIGAAFNSMSSNVLDSILKIENISKSFSRFVPFEMFSAVNKNNILDVNLGDYAQIEASILQLYINEFDEYRGTELFSVLNQFYTGVIPKILINNGMIERYSDSNMVSIFKSSPFKALKSAIKIFEDSENSKEIGITAVIGFFKITVGVIGNAERLQVNIISRQTYILEQIGKLGRRLGCFIILTETAKKEIADLIESYHYRLMGYVEIGGKLEEIYDVFDGDFSDLRFSKLDTKKVFESAVRLYYDGKFYEARAKFIEVIKLSPRDLCAKEYLKLSDTLYQNFGDVEPLLVL